MTKKNAVYAPGELDKVRKNLGAIDEQEAKRIAQLLGGEVGVERPAAKAAARGGLTQRRRPLPESPESPESPAPPAAREKNQGQRLGEAPPDQWTAADKPAHPKKDDGADDPSVPIKRRYWDRITMDKYAGEPEFRIKNFWQILYSILSIFGDIPDMVNPAFVKRRLNDCYQQIETLVNSVRILLPRNNTRRNRRFERLSPFAYSILNTIRYWDIERLSSEMTRVQAHPRSVTVTDLADILRIIYKPIFILEELDMEAHIKETYKLLYRLLLTETPAEAQEKCEESIKTSLASLIVIRKNIRFLLYPLLLKLLSDRFLPYGQFFTERKNRFMAFIGAWEEDQISPLNEDFYMAQQQEADPQPENAAGEESPSGDTAAAEKDEEDPKAAAKRAAQAAEKKAVDRGLETLELLFPQAGWKEIRALPDFYPYFADIFDLRKNYELIPPSDPLQQVVILLRILEELFFGLRSVSFGVIAGPDGNPEEIGGAISDILNKWNSCVEVSLEKEYLPRLADYCRMLDVSAESRHSTYAKRILNELQWLRRLYLFPYYRFTSFTPMPNKKNEIIPLYPEIRRLRRYLTAVAAGIEGGNKNGGAEANASCDGIDNPWAPYVFQIENPLSRRLNTLLKNSKQQTNASLVFFTLSVVTVLDHIINNEHSWAYEAMPEIFFRSVRGEGLIPQYSVEAKVDTAAIFKRQMKRQA